MGSSLKAGMKTFQKSKLLCTVLCYFPQLPGLLSGMEQANLNTKGNRTSQITCQNMVKKTFSELRVKAIDFLKHVLFSLKLASTVDDEQHETCSQRAFHV